MDKAEFENLNLFTEFASRSGFNLFLGAGFSVYAKNDKDEQLPLGNSIGESIANLFELDYDKYQKSLGNLCRKIKLSKKDILNTFLRDTYKVKEYDPCYDVLPSLPIKNIITLNIDDLIEKVYSSPDSIKDIADTKICGNVEKENTVPLFKLHGSVTYPIEQELSFTSEEIQSLFTTDNSLFNAISYKLSCCPTIFWGSSFSDGNTAQLIQNGIKKYCVSNVPQWIVLYPNDENYEFLYETFHDLGFYIIKTDTKELLEFLCSLPLMVKKIDEKNKYSNYRMMFPNNFVCNELKKKTVSRPISDFFKGDEPQISDVLSESITKTSYYNIVLNKIIRNKETTLVTGIPGCGKSTLLLQLAFSDDVSGRKFWFNNMIESEATRLCELIKDDDNVTVFFDNLYNNLEAFKILKNHNVRIITAERTINYEYVKSTLSINKENIIDVSDLNEIDIQKICNSMKKSSDKAISLLKSKNNVSLLEIAFLSYHAVTVKTKIREFIDSVTKYNDKNLKISLIELYSLVNYVSYCGVPISMDMLMFYFSDKGIEYKDIFYAINKLNNIIVDDQSANRNINQDYMIFRSKVFAELSMKNISSHIIKKVLFTFHKNISSSIIYRYDIFKRKAYDADLTTMMSYNDGTRFYKDIIQKNSSPYVKQQFALFLYRKNDIVNAWKVIDNAYTQCNGKIFTIANTHAVILFNKNIDSKCPIEKETELKQLLKRSFDTLEDCVTKDVKANYHVLIYGRNVVRYLERFGVDEFSKNYIKKAIKNIDKILESDEFIYKKLKDELYNIRYELIQKRTEYNN